MQAATIAIRSRRAVAMSTITKRNRHHYHVLVPSKRDDCPLKKRQVKQEKQIHATGTRAYKFPYKRAYTRAHKHAREGADKKRPQTRKQTCTQTRTHARTQTSEQTRTHAPTRTPTQRPTQRSTETPMSTGIQNHAKTRKNVRVNTRACAHTHNAQVPKYASRHLDGIRNFRHRRWTEDERRAMSSFNAG